MLVSAEELLLLLHSNETVIFIGTIMLKLFCSNMLHSLNVKVERNSHGSLSTPMFSGLLWFHNARIFY